MGKTWYHVLSSIKTGGQTLTEQDVKLTKSEIYESIGSVFWLLMDFGWFKELEIITLLLIPPTILSHILALFLVERRFVYVSLMSAVNFWVIANAFWIIADLKSIPTLNLTAEIFFWLAMALTAMTLIKMAKEGNLPLFFYKFRRFRIRIR